MIYPLFAMVALTFVVMAWTFISRVQAVRAGKVSMGHFRLMQGEAPESVVKASRQFSNLFEMPVLFYAVCLLSLIKPMDDAWLVPLAWAFVVSRCLHAIIHLSYNNILHRLTAFAVSNLVLLALWLRVISYF